MSKKRFVVVDTWTHREVEEFDNLVNATAWAIKWNKTIGANKFVALTRS